MALTKNLTLVDNFGIDVTIHNAYIKVSRTDCNKTDIVAYVEVSKAKGENPINSKPYLFLHNLDAANPIKQAYDYLKTLPEYSGAQDC